MGRILDTLRGTDKFPRQTAGECVVDWSLPEVEEIPFIEVGGGKKLEASAKVLAAPAPQVHSAQAHAAQAAPQAHAPQAHAAQAPQPPHAPTLKQLPTVPVVEFTATAPLHVALEPLPQPAPTRPTVSRDVVAFHQHEHAVTRQYGQLLEQMWTQGGEGESACLLLSGLRTGIGTTTVLANLGVLAARDLKKRTVLMESPSRHGGAARMLGVNSGPGIREVAGGTAALDRAVHPTAVERLFVLPVGQGGTEGPTRSPSAAAWLIGWLKQRFDLILFDGPTLDDESLVTSAPLADALFVVAGQEDRHLLPRDLARTITGMGGKLRGVLNTSLT